MRTGIKVAMALTGLLTLTAGTVTGAFGWFMWALALNGFMGQSRAVNASLATYVSLAVLVTLVSVALSVFAVYVLALRRGWNAVVSAVMSILTFTVASGVLHGACVIVSAIVAEEMRIKR